MNGGNRFYQKDDLLPLMQKHRNDPVVVFDLETNGLYGDNSVLSCSALKLLFDSSGEPTGKYYPFREIDFFERYYFAVEPENLSAIRINGLSSNVITEHRAGHDWPVYFRDDHDFRDFCDDAGIFVAHNIEFDAQFVPFMAGRNLFCTMKTNTVRKYPKLSELAAEYGIEVMPTHLHQSGYDTMLTAQIFRKMVAGLLPGLIQGELF